MSGAVRFDVDPSNRIASWPEDAVDLFGTPTREALGRSWVEVLGARDPAGNRLCSGSCALHTMARRGEPIQVFELVASLHGEPDVRLFGRAEAVDGDAVRGLRIVLWRERRRGSLDRSRSGATAVETGPSAAPPLTPRQVEVLRLISRGHGIEEIAHRLGISAATARNHAQRVLPKLGASNRAEAVSIAIRRGIL